jgi:DNA helicase-2/ATP-dependent DNA helicase PcrA
MEIDKFLSEFRSMICAPAGYGKTHTIISSVILNSSTLPILVLTHTNAGVAAIREKAKTNKIDMHRLVVSTICGYAQMLVDYFVKNNFSLPQQNDASLYYKAIITEACKVSFSAPVQLFLSKSYSHIIVDEFQDCSLEQFKLIETIGKMIPIHILGDYLQSIYGFNNDTIVDMNGTECEIYRRNIQTLETPWRWINASSKELGEELHSIRQRLENELSIDLSKLIYVKYFPYNEGDKYVNNSPYKRAMSHICNYNGKEKIVLITPHDNILGYRNKIIKSYHSLILLEAVDAKDFYTVAHDLDEMTASTALKTIVKIFRQYAKKTVIDRYININGEIKKCRKAEYIQINKKLSEAVEQMTTQYNYLNIIKFIETLERLPDMRIFRCQIIYDAKLALKEAACNKTLIETAMIKIHNTRRRVGRQIRSKSVGTALLTKGLEFDHVVILDAHLFTDKKFFYVALTRGCKSVTIISEKKILKFKD